MNPPSDRTAPADGAARRRDVLSWIAACVAVVALGAVAWACLTAWEAIVHGHPAYAVLLGLTALLAAAGIAVALRGARPRTALRLTARIALVIAASSGIAVVAWLRPYPVVEPALAAMHSDDRVTVTESADRIVFSPTGEPFATAVFFQPGALVDARAYAAVLRPLAEAGHPVVIAKQPLGIAFLATGAFDAARSVLPDASAWVVGGHSLGGTVASLQADQADQVAGLLLYASYPASDIRESLTADVLSISGTEDGLATPEKITASAATLPADAEFLVLEGVSHAQFGAYGPQPGDGVPQVSDETARTWISDASVMFVDDAGAD
ncbi:alpha/beta hydrolase [Microbacterium xanthum]|uniref:alpha/beta hydrolase n=1 Tax=Microbacterium xanthum TaxID=3079794 RepID=UPI002AD526E7|nr:alpha/beta hydrolase [Microbacterium sp. KSW-48]MDZ8171570.1 alpha/beta hydrolase [Microbacterium sp. KSW-48]